MPKIKYTNEDIRISIVRDVFRPPQEIEDVVNLIWENAIAKHSFLLTNSKVLHFIERVNNSIIVQVCEYKYFFAQTKQPTLFASLNITILAVSGITICRNGIVVGKRSTNLLQDPGYWELTPSGSISAPDLSLNLVSDYARDQVIVELEEELGIKSREIESISLVGSIMDTDANVFDLLFVITTTITRRELYSRFTHTANDEYTEIHVVPSWFISTFLWYKGNRVVTSSRELLGILKKYSRN
jgi:hypothetical protein